jgi:hypothetical protein
MAFKDLYTTLEAGRLKLIFVDPYALEENARRKNAGGTIFIAPFVIAEARSGIWRAREIKAAKLTARYDLRGAKVSLPDLPRELRDVPAWMETNRALDILP